MPHTGLRRLLAAALLASLLVLSGCSSGSGESSAGSGDTKDGQSPKQSEPAAPQGKPGPGDQTVRLDWKGKQRTYLVHAPPSYTPGEKIPLVIAMHAYPSTPARIAALSDLSAKADEENFLVVYPEGLDGGMNALVCCGSEDDVGFIRTLTKSLVDTWGADPRRIYATGISNGGDMTYRLAVELSDTFAAIAPVSGGYTGSPTADDAYLPTSPVSVLTFIGGEDRWYQAFDEGIGTWQSRLACEPGPAAKLPQKITHTTARCADGSEVQVYRLPAMGHSWPQGKGDMADRDAAVNATDLMWEFFDSHPKKAT